MSQEEKTWKDPVYIIRVKGCLDRHWMEWFRSMSITYTDSGESVLWGPVIDQPALHGMLEKIRDLNLTLISVQMIDRDEP